MSVHRRVPIVTPVKGRRQFLWWCNIGAAVQNMTDFVWILFVHTCQGQLGETFGSMNIKYSAGRLHLGAFLVSSVVGRNAQHGRCHKCANKLLQKRRIKFEDHSGHNHASVSLRKDR